MLASASKIEVVRQPWRRLLPAGLSHIGPRVGRGWDSEKMRRLGVCLSVSVVSPNLRLIEEYRGKMQEQALIGAKASALRQVRPVQRCQVFVVRQQGRDTSETGGTVPPFHAWPEQAFS